MQVQDLDTPALLVDLDILEENTARMRSIAQKAGVALRPHYKSHHCPGLARMQMAYAKGFTCAKVGEAEDLATAGVGDILIAHQLTRPEKPRRLCRLAGKTSVTVCVDDGDNVRELERFAAEDGVRLSVLVEFEIGMGRCGVERFDEVLCLAREISRQPHLHFRGIQAYAGHLAHERDWEKRFVSDALPLSGSFLPARGVRLRRSAA